ncbi:MAG: T9SS type A sorting domain-containing protein [Sphingobacteriaceae bacterium]|nr:T9SS type A sorting domain-containing protein [Sphingobacteriaceae bacterium]
MFYKFTQLAVICSMVLCMCLGSSAQTPLAQQHIDRYSLLQPFVPEGILIDRSPLSLLRNRDGLDPDKFSLNQLDTADFSLFRDYYRLFYHASYQANRFPLIPDTLSDMAERQAYGATYGLPALQREKEFDLIIAAMRFQYREIAENALDCFYVYYDQPIDKYRLGIGNIAIYDTVWLDNTGASYTIVNSSHSLNTQQALAHWSVIRDFFMFTADQSTAYVYPGQPMRVKFPSELFFGSLVGVTLQIDFEDGIGFRTITPGSTYLVNYLQGGTKYIKARLLNADGGIMTNQSAVATVKVGIMRIGPPSSILFSNTSGCQILASTPDGFGAAFIKLSPMNNNQLRKPYVLVEGIETESYVKGNNILVPGNNLGFGDLSWQQISSGIFGPGMEHLEPLTDFVDSLGKLGYDFVFVDFLTNRATIESNAKALASLISQLNAQLELNGSTEQLEIIGASMGGLIARVALRELELNGCCHNVKLFTTFSTPHLGANIPLAFQQSMKDMISRYNFLGNMDELQNQYHSILNSPAARQLLVYHAEVGAETERAAFHQYLQRIGHPMEARKLAITNGSIVGDIQRSDVPLSSPFLTPGSQLLLFTAEIWVPTSFPLPLNQRSYRQAGSNGMFLVRSEGFILPHSPGTASNQLYYKGGKSIHSNLNDVFQAHLKYSISAYKFFIKAKAITIAAMTNPAAAAVIIASGAVKLAIFSAGVNQSLLNGFNSNISDNQAGSVLLHANFPSLGVDYAPGDFAGSVNDLKNGFITKRQFSLVHTFVPSVSSVDFNLDLFSSLISVSQNPSNVYSSFEGVISGKSGPDLSNINTRHVSVLPSLLEPVYLNQLTTRSSHISSLGVLTSDLTVGKPIAPRIETNILNSDVEIYNWTIANNAKLNVNAFANLNYGHSAPGVPLNMTPRPNSHFITKTTTYDCDSVHVTVQGGGTFELGEITPGNRMTAAVHFRKASTLTLLPGAMLKVNNFSTLIMEAGSTLIVHPGASIQLLGDSAILEIQGDVVLLDQAMFSFSGGGFLRVNQGTLNAPTGGWSMGQNSRIQLLGASRADLLAEVIGEWLIGQPNGLVKITNGQVFLRQNARMNFHSSVELYQVLLTGNTNARHGGLVLHGQPSVAINKVEVRNAAKGITAYLLSQQNGLTLNEVVLNHNLIGLETHGRAVNLFNARGSFNGTFWKALDVEGFSRVRDCRITQNFRGIDVMGQHGARLDIMNSTLDSNNIAVFSFGNMQLRAFCSSFSSNFRGFYCGNTQVLIGGQAQNRFRNNDVAIYLEEVDNLYIHKGENDFTGSNWYITGMFSGIANNYLHMIPNVNGYFLNIQDNKMPLVAQQLPIDLLDYDGFPVLPHNWTFVSTVPTACVRTNGASFETHVISNLASPLHVYVNGQLQTLGSALLDALALVSTDEIVVNPNDLVALGKFNEIFTSLRGQNIEVYTDAELLVLDIALSRMIEALSNAYRFNLIQAARANKFYPLSNEINGVVTELAYRIQNASQLFLQDERALKMKLAHVYRTGEYYDKAMTALSDIISTTDLGSDLRTQAEYWLCVCAAESELISGEISALDFEARRAPCLMLIPEMRRPAKSWNPFTIQQQLQEVPVVVLYPNPSVGAVRLKQTADNGAARVTVVSMDGKVLHNLSWPSAYEELVLERETLPAGVYVVKIEFENSKVSRVRWTIL